MPEADVWWADSSFTQPLDWEIGVIQFAHHSFSPEKDCDTCGPNSWQWDNIEISPTRPFTIIPAEQRFVNRGTGGELYFATAAPEQSYVRFMALSEQVQLSFDGGNSWQLAQQAPYQQGTNGFQPYWTPIPAGVNQIDFRALDDSGSDWQIRDISIWSLAAP